MNLLQTIAIVSLAIGGLCLLIMVIDLLTGHARKMRSMNIVWPATGLYAGPFALLAYYTIGRKALRKNKKGIHNNGDGHTKKKPFWQSMVVGTLHCGSGCTLGNIIAEFGLVLFPFVIFGSKLYGGWVVDYIIAFLIGIIFQYYAIKPMKNLSPGKAIVVALKADTLSLTSWQIGMYGWIAVSVLLIFHRRLEATEPLFWFMMQIGMMLGFITAYPINWWLIKNKIKEEM